MPRKDLVATIRPLDDYSNTYIGLYVEDPNLGREIFMVYLRGYAKRRIQGLVNFVSALAHHLCPALPAAFTQPRALLLADPFR